jgi:hypothetical protein
LVDWTQTVNTIDYGIKAVTENGDQTTVSLEVGRMPMPIDLLVEYTDGTMETFLCAFTNDELRERKSVSSDKKRC